MVYKYYKGFRTSNTVKKNYLKRSQDLHNKGEVLTVRKYNIGTGIETRKIKQATKQADLQIKGAERFSTEVSYSLKKHKRWQSVSKLKERVEGLRHANEASVVIQWRHLINRESNCYAWIGTKNSTEAFGVRKQRRRKKKQTYRNAHSAVCEEKASCAQGEQNSCSTFMEISVYTSPPKDSYVSVSPKMAMMFEVNAGTSKPSEGRGGHCTTNRKFGRLSTNDYRMELCDDDDANEDVVESVEQEMFLRSVLEKDKCSNSVPRKTFSLEDFIVSKSKQKKNNQRKREKEFKKLETLMENTSSKPVISRQQSATPETLRNTSATVEETASSDLGIVPAEKVDLTFPKNELKPKNLLRLFGDNYLESHSTPRKFIVDITSKIAKSFEKCSTKQKKGTAIIIIEELTNLDESLVSCRMQLNLNAKLSEEQNTSLSGDLKQLGNNNFNDMNELVSKTVNVLKNVFSWEMINRFYWEQDDIVDRFASKGICIGWCPTDALSETSALQRVWETDMELKKATIDRQKSQIEDSFVMISPNCEICTEDIQDWTNSVIQDDQDDLKEGTAMRKCGHYFCNDCWRSHLINQINQGQITLKCPSFNCEEVVDAATALCFLPLSFYQQHMTLLKTVRLESNPQYKWCPNNNCRRVLRILKRHLADEQPISVQCTCGAVICFLCLREAHWPASCEHAQLYMHKLKRLGDDKLVPMDASDYEVRGKSCPRCSLFIVKNGGCNHMTCRCGFQFCWWCLQDYAAHTGGPCTSINSKFQKREAAVVEVRSQYRALQVTKEKTKDYIAGVTHRLKRHPNVKNELKKKTPEILTMIQMAHGSRKLLKAINKENVRSIYNICDGAEFEMDRMLRNYFQLRICAEYSYVIIQKGSTYQDCANLRECLYQLDFLTDSIGNLLLKDRTTRSSLTEAVKDYKQITFYFDKANRTTQIIRYLRQKLYTCTNQ